MDAPHLVVSIVLAIPMARVIERVAMRFSTSRPWFRNEPSPRLGLRTIMVTTLVVGVYVATAFRFDRSGWAEYVAYLALFAVLVLLSIIDIGEYRLPDVIVLPAIALGAVIVVVVSLLDDDPDRIGHALIGAAVAFVVLLAAHLVSPQGMGFGDVKFALLLGLAVGWQAGTMIESLILVLWMLLIGFGVGSLVGVVLWIVRRRNAPFPFGPFLAIGTFVTVMVSGSLVG
ncbi:MAG: prepilin peptidase [Acidimicrobiia bacterium]